MIHYARTSNLAFVRELITHPLIYPYAGDDSAPAAEDFQVVNDERVWYVLAYTDPPADSGDERELLGGFMAYPQTSTCWEIHVLLLPAGRDGRRVRGSEIARGVFAWLFHNTPALRIVGATPACYRLAAKLSRDAGLIEYGRNPNAFLKWGKLHDLILAGISKD